MSRVAVVLLSCGMVFSAFSGMRAQEMEVVPATGDPKVYGEYPIAYKEIIQRWLAGRLADPASAVIDWAEPPKPGDVTPKKGERFVGYVVDFKVNARNQFGTATGKQKYRAVIRNGDVLWGGRPLP